jgi:hypothetical protein
MTLSYLGILFKGFKDKAWPFWYSISYDSLFIWFNPFCLIIISLTKSFFPNIHYGLRINKIIENFMKLFFF